MLNYNEKQLIDDMAEACDLWDVSYTDKGLKANLDMWAEEKEPLVNLLRRHPNWNERAMGVVFTTEEHRDFDLKKFKNALGDLFYTQYPGTLFNEEAVDKIMPEAKTMSLCYSSQTNFKNYVYSILYRNIKSSRADSSLVEKLKNSALSPEVTKNFKEGMKVSRIINAIIEPTINKNNPEMVGFYNKVFARLADSLNPMTITKYTILSVHPADFLTMSNGTGWESCHNLRDGGWRGGCLSYLTDDVSMILYTVTPSYDGNQYFAQEKINRQIYCLGADNRLLQSRLYPQNESDDHCLSDNFRANVQEILSTCLDIPNLWIKSSASPSNFFIAGNYNKAYEDWDYPENWYVNVSYPKNTNLSDYRTPIGGPGCCLDCGAIMYYADSEEIYCKECNGIICCECGCVVFNEDHGHWIDGDFYCEDCVFYCEYHETYEPIAWQSVYDNYICQEAYDNLYRECTCCGRDGLESEGIWFDGDFYCEECTFYCSYHQRYEPITIQSEEDYDLCKEAFNEQYFVCEECGAVTPIDHMVVAGGRNLCIHCAADLTKEEIA